MAKFLNLLRLRSFANPGDAAAEVSTINDTFPRLRIDAGGKLTWGDGSLAGDANLYRHPTAGNVLATDNNFWALGGITTITTDGVPTEALPDGAIAVDTTNNVFYFRSGGVWLQVSGGGASIEISDTAPASPESGDLWFESDTGSLYVYYDSFWIEVGGGGGGGSDPTLSQKVSNQMTYLIMEVAP